MDNAAVPAGYAEARSSAAFFPIWDGGRFRMLGADAQDFLHRMVTNDIRGLTPGHGIYAALLDINGRMTADLWAWLLDTDNILVETAASAQDTLTATLDKYIIMEEVELQDARDALAVVSVQGPEAHEAAERALGAVLPQLEPGEAWESTADASDLVAANRDRTGQGGLDVYVPAQRLDWLLSGLRGSGVAEGSPEALETLRIEAGIPKWGAELDASVIPLEANLENVAVSFTKGCYPGQEIIARIHSRAQPARRLVGIRFAQKPPAPGAEVEKDGQTIGRVTSSVVSPTLGGLALAYLKRDFATPNLEVTATGIPGVTAALPFGAI